MQLIVDMQRQIVSEARQSRSSHHT